MTRGPASSSRIRRPLIPNPDATDWIPLVDTWRSPSTDGSGSRRGSVGSHVGSQGEHSQGEHSHSQGDGSGTNADVDFLEPWPAALLHSDSDSRAAVSEESEAAVSQESEATASEDSLIGDHRLPIAFNNFGQPIGPTKSKYATKIGKITRNFASPKYEDWRIVPWGVKEEIWKSLKNVYRVPEVIKDKALKMAHKAWKNLKTKLRRICYKCSSVAEMINKYPKCVKKEDWEAFCNMVSQDADLVLRQKMAAARKAIKALHSTGRAGIAQRREKLEKESPTGEVTRAILYLATHVYQEMSEDELANFDPLSYEVTSRGFVAKVREYNEMEEYKNETHLDRDAVAKTFGRDRRGIVRGMGGGVSKTELLASAVSRELLREEKLKTAASETRLRILEEKVAGLTVNPSTTNANNTQPLNVCGQRIQNVVVRNMRMNPVAFGRIDRTRNETDQVYYEVLIDEIVLHNERLCVGDGTLADICVGEKIKWPKHSVTIVTVLTDGF